MKRSKLPFTGIIIGAILALLAYFFLWGTPASSTERVPAEEEVSPVVLTPCVIWKDVIDLLVKIIEPSLEAAKKEAGTTISETERKAELKELLNMISAHYHIVESEADCPPGRKIERIKRDNETVR